MRIELSDTRMGTAYALLSTLAHAPKITHTPHLLSPHHTQLGNLCKKFFKSLQKLAPATFLCQ